MLPLIKKIQEKACAARTKEHKLFTIERTQSAYEAIQKRYNTVSKEKTEAYFDTLIAKDENSCCACCKVLAQSELFPVIASATLVTTCSLANFCLHLLPRNQINDVIVGMTCLGSAFGFGCIAHTLCSDECNKFLEYRKHKVEKQFNFKLPQMHTIPAVNTEQDKEV